MTNNEETNYKIMINTEADTIFIQFKDEKYKDVIAKVGHIEINDNGEIEFDMEVPQGQEKYYDDEDFCNEVQKAVGDIVAKSVNSYWNEAERNILNDLESKVSTVLTQKGVKKDEEKSFVEIFGEKGYVLSEDDEDRLVAINSKTEEIYHFDNEDDFKFLKKEIFNLSLIM